MSHWAVRLAGAVGLYLIMAFWIAQDHAGWSAVSCGAATANLLIGIHDGAFGRHEDAEVDAS